MKQEFPQIKIGGLPKKVYSIDLSGGGSEPATLRISFLADNTDYTPNSNKEYTVQIGSYYTFKGYIVSSSIRNSVSSGRTKELTLVDTSIILDKHWVGLKGKDGPPQAPLLTSNIGIVGRNQNANINFGVLNPINTLNTNTRNINSTPPIPIFEYDGIFPDKLILVGDAIDPCKDFDSDNPIDKCNPCAQEPTSKLDCFNRRSIDILDVDYTFNQLITAASAKQGISFDSTFESAVNYRAQYKGTLREVLNNWCQDYGYSFYWEDGRVKFINLSNGIPIRDEGIRLEKCKIEDFSETQSIEGNSKTVNIAYFGKAGESPTYDCSKSDSGSKSEAGETEVLLTCVSLEALFKGNSSLESRYKSEDILRIMVTASYYSKDLRDLICYLRLLKFENPSLVKLGPQPLMGWDIKGIAYENTTDDDVSSDYTSGGLKRLYSSLLGSKNGKSAIFSAEKIEQIKKNKGYFLIVNLIGTKAYDFEKNLAENFCGRYWTKATNRTEGVTFESPEGSAKAYPNLIQKKSFVLPGIDITHPYIKNADISILNPDNFKNNTDFIILDRPQTWSPSPDSDSVEDFLNEVLKVKFEDITSQVGVFKLKKDHKVYLVYEFGSGSGLVNIGAIPSNQSTHPSDRVPRGSSFDGQPVLGIRSDKCTKIKFSIDVPPVKGRSSKKEINIYMPVMSGSYLIRRKYSGTTLRAGGPLKTIIPKLEIIVSDAENNLNDDDCVSYNVNSQNITDNNLSRLERIGFNCYIDKAKVYSYAKSILSDINQNNPKIKITKNYTILGLPKTKFTPEDGLTSFSIRLDQGGTRTSLSFSNMFPVGQSSTFKEQKLRNLLKEQSGKSFTK